MRQIAAFAGIAMLLSAPGAAFAETDQVVGVTDGGLAATALATGEFRAAAQRLNAPTPDGVNDAGRLINLGNAYAGMGRYADARIAYRSARYAPEVMLVLADGSEASSRDIAARAMGRLGVSYASR